MASNSDGKSNAKEPDVHLELDENTADLFSQKGFVAQRMLRKGAYGHVFRGINQNTNKPVAIKVVFLEKVTGTIKNKFLPREIVTLMQVGHPHIVHILDIMRAGQKLFIIMEFAPSGDLTQYIKQNGPIPEPRTAMWFAQVGSALHYTHIEQRLCHRDIKMENVLLFEDVAKLTDFGL